MSGFTTCINMYIIVLFHLRKKILVIMKHVHVEIVSNAQFRHQGERKGDMLLTMLTMLLYGLLAYSVLYCNKF